MGCADERLSATLLLKVNNTGGITEPNRLLSLHKSRRALPLLVRPSECLANHGSAFRSSSAQDYSLGCTHEVHAHSNALLAVLVDSKAYLALSTGLDLIAARVQGANMTIFAGAQEYQVHLGYSVGSLCHNRIVLGSQSLLILSSHSSRFSFSYLVNVCVRDAAGGDERVNSILEALVLPDPLVAKEYVHLGEIKVILAETLQGLNNRSPRNRH
mmetsp:Transcript_36615/g.57200  ORF Transcript_36615/g.57200 Transcript_36615/m.57200 type:complete len:214 (+) Transcript_36615:358-999(+)